VPAAALVLALAAALGHAVWNLLLARARDPEAATAVAMLVGVIVFALPAALAWDVERSVWPYALASSLLELVYIALLAAAYRVSELSLVYPVGRGVAPVLVLVAGVALLGAGTTAVQAAGVCLVGAGVLLVGRIRREPDWRGIAYGLAIAACIAGYTLADNGGVERANPLAYLELVIVPAAVAYFGGVLAVKGRAAIRAELNVSSFVAGLLILSPFALFLVALDLAPAAPVAAVRESSVVIATGFAALFLGERVTAARWIGAVLVALGVALVAL
jgi:drug/metabolite transporter (DMT)-like permease